MIYKLNDGGAAKPLFAGWEETILYSCLENIMGEVYGDDPMHLGSAMACLGDFCFFGGTPKGETAEAAPRFLGDRYLILVPENEGWETVIQETFGPRVRPITRYATKKEGDVFDREKLASMAAALPDGYEARLMDRELYDACLQENWSRDLTGQFLNFEEFLRLGLGIVILKDGKPVSGASAYSRYRDGIEIEIDTKPEFRRKGLARACGAGLILESLKRGLYPSWDAHNLESVRLAQSLGYRLDHEYRAFEYLAGAILE